MPLTQEYIDLFGNIGQGTTAHTTADKIYDADTLYQNGEGYRVAGIDAPEMPTIDLKLQRLQKAKESKLGQFVSKATAGEAAKLEAELSTLNMNGMDAGFKETSFNDSMAAPQYQEAPESGKQGVYGRNILENPQYQNDLVARGYAIPAFDNQTPEAQKLMLEAKKKRLGLWADPEYAKEMEAVAAKRGTATVEEIPDYNIARGFGSAALNVGAKIGSLVGEGVETVGEKLNLDTLKGTGKAVQDAYTKMQMTNFADTITGYSSRNMDELQADISKDIKENGILHAIGNTVTDPRALEGLVVSAPEMIALAASLGTMAVANANNNINIGEAKLGRPMTGEEKAGSVVASVVGTYLDRFGDKLAISGVTPVKQVLKEAIQGLNATQKRTLINTYGKGILKIGEAPLRLAGAGVVEGLTETGQTLLENAAQDPSRVWDKGFSDQDIEEAKVAGVMGAAMGTHMATPKVAIDTVKDALPEGETQRAKNAREIYNTPMTDLVNETDKDKQRNTNAVLDYTTLMVLDPEEAAANGYTGKQVIDNAVNKLAEIHGLSEEAKQYAYADVIDGIKTSLIKNGKDVVDSKQKMRVFDTVMQMVKGEKKAEAAVQDAIDDTIAEEMETYSKKVSDALDKNIDLSSIKLNDEEKAKIDTLLAQMKEMGSEEIVGRAEDIEKAIKGLGRKKSFEEVRNDIKKAGFIFFGKGYKSLDRHERDIERVDVTGEETSSVLGAFDKFVKSRSQRKVQFSKKMDDGTIIDRSLEELKRFGTIVQEDNNEIIKSIDTMLKTVKNEDTITRLNELRTELLDTNSKYDNLNTASTLDEYKDIYSGKVTEKPAKKPAEPKAEKKVEPKKEKPTMSRQTLLTEAGKIAASSKDAVDAVAKFNVMEGVSDISNETRSEIEEYIRSKFAEEETKTGPTKEPEPKVEEKVAEKPQPKVEKKVVEELSEEVVEDTTPVIEEVDYKKEVQYYKENLVVAERFYKDAKKNLKDINDRIGILKNQLDNIKTEKARFKEDLGIIRKDIAKAESMIAKADKDVERQKGQKAVSFIQSIIKELVRLIRNSEKRLKYAITKKYAKELELEETMSAIQDLNKAFDQTVTELRALKIKRVEATEKVIAERVEVADIKERLRESEEMLKAATYGAESATIFKAIDTERVTAGSIVSVLDSSKNYEGKRGNAKSAVIDSVASSIAEELVALMPRSVKKMMKKKRNYLNDGVKYFIQYRNGDKGVTRGRVDVPNQMDSSVTAFLNDWLKNPEAKDRLNVALDIAGVTAMSDMMNMRSMNTTMLDDAIVGAFGIAQDDPMLKVIRKAVQKGEYVPMSTFTASAGQRVMKELGLVFNKDMVSNQDKQDIMFGLGQLALERAKIPFAGDEQPSDIGITQKALLISRSDIGMVERVEELDGFIEGVEVENTRRIVKLDSIKDPKRLRQMASVLEYASEQSDGEISFEPTVLTKKKIRNRNVDMSDDAIKYINKNNSIAWKFSDDFKAIYNDLKALTGGGDINKLMYDITLDSITREDLKTMSAADIESKVAKIEAEKLEIDRMIMAYELAGDDAFYLNWDQTGSDRFMIDNRMVNPQNSKISRFLIGTQDMQSTLEKVDGKYNEKDIAVVKGAIAQAFDMGIDKGTDADVFAKMGKELVDISDNGTKVEFKDEALRKATAYYYKGKVAKATEVLKKEMRIPTNEIYHALQAVKVLSGLAGKQDKIDHNLIVEVDAITNGMILTGLEEGSKESMELVAKGGVYTGKMLGKYKNHGEYKKAGGLDIYQTPIEAMSTTLGKQSSPIVGLVTDLLSKDGKKDLNKWRKALKPLVMVYIYGAGMKSIVNKAGEEFGSMVINDIVKNKDYYKLDELVRNVEGLEMKNIQTVNKKRLATSGTVMYTGTVTPETVGDIYLTPYQEYLLNKAISTEFGPAISESFASSFPQINNFRQALKAVSVLKYVAFKQELNRLVENRDVVTITELEKILDSMKEKGLYYGNTNAHGSIQDYVKMSEYDQNSVEVTGFMGKASKGNSKQITVNSAMKWFASNIGAIGVIDIHSKDGRTMLEANMDGSLNIYDALMMAANYNKASENTQKMNEAVINVSRKHSAFAEMMESTYKILDNVKIEELTRELVSEITNDLNRVFAAEDEVDLVDIKNIGNVIKAVRDNRKNVGKKMLVNHVYALDSIDGVVANESDVRTVELTDEQIDSMVDKLVGLYTNDTATAKYTEKMQSLNSDKYKGLSKKMYDKIQRELRIKANTSLDKIAEKLIKGCE